MIGRATRLVVEREVREAARRRGIWALVGLVFIGSAALMIVPELLPDGRDGTVVLVGADDAGVAEALRAVDERDLEVATLPDRNAAVVAVEDGDADLAVVLERPPVLLADDPSSSLVGIVGETVANRLAAGELRTRGIQPELVADAFIVSTPVVEPVDVERQSRESAAIALTAVLYILTVVLTGQVASGVAIEKSNRVSEVLLAIVPPRSMLAGKVIGVGAIGLATVAAGAIPVIVRLAVGGDLPADLGRTLAVSAVWFVGGLALYLTIAGSLGALVSRQEEAGAIVAPLTTLLVGGYFVTVVAADTDVGGVLALIPLLSPMMEPYRIAIGAGSPVEYGLSLVLLFGSVALVGRVGAVVFRRAIVRTGRRLRLREVLTRSGADR